MNYISHICSLAQAPPVESGLPCDLLCRMERDSCCMASQAWSKEMLQLLPGVSSFHVGSLSTPETMMLGRTHVGTQVNISS